MQSDHRTNNSTITLPLFEKKSYDYFYVDLQSNKIHVMVPIVGGEEFGTDNTCETTNALRNFCKEIAGIIATYMDDLTSDISFLTTHYPNHPDIENKNQRLLQLRKLNTVVDKITPVIESAIFSNTFGKLPSQFHHILQASNINCVSITLSPLIKDDYTRFKNSLCAFNRTNDQNSFKAQYVKTINAAYLTVLRLREFAGQSLKGNLIKLVIERYQLEAKNFNCGHLHITQETELTLLKKCIYLVFNEQRIDLTSNALEKDKKNADTTFAYFTETVACCDATSSLKEWVSSIFSATLIDETFSEQSPFKDNDCHRSLDAYDKGNIKIQLFLAIINLYYYQKTQKKYNFAAVIEKSSTLMREFVDAILTGIQNNLEIESAIFQFINANSRSTFLFSGTFFNFPLTHNEMKEIKDKFNRLWAGLKDSPHFDEFLLLLPDNKGRVFTHQGRICIPLSDFVFEFSLELYLRYFTTGELSSTVQNNRATEHIQALPSNHPEICDLQIPQHDFINLDTRMIAEMLCHMSKKGELYLKQRLENNLKHAILTRDDFLEIFSICLNSSNLSINYQAFLKLFDLDGVCPIDLTDLMKIYEINFSEELKKLQPSAYNEKIHFLLDYKNYVSQCESKKADLSIDFIENIDALFCVDKVPSLLKKASRYIAVDRAEFNAAGKIILHFNRDQIESSINALLQLLKKAKELDRFYLTSTMVDFFISQSQVNNLTQENKLTLLKAALSKLLQIRESDIGFSRYTPLPTERRYCLNLWAIDINFSVQLYQIFGDNKICSDIIKKYRQLLTMVIEEDQAQLLISHLSNQDEKSSDKSSDMISANIEKTLNEKKINFHAIQKINESCWSIILDSPRDKLALEALCGENLLINQRLEAKAHELASHFYFSAIEIVSAHTHPSEVNSLSITSSGSSQTAQQLMVRITFNNLTAMNNFSAILNVLRFQNDNPKNYILSGHCSERNIIAIFSIDLLNDFTILQFKAADTSRSVIQKNGLSSPKQPVTPDDIDEDELAALKCMVRGCLQGFIEKKNTLFAMVDHRLKNLCDYIGKKETALSEIIELLKNELTLIDEKFDDPGLYKEMVIRLIDKCMQLQTNNKPTPTLKFI